MWVLLEFPRFGGASMQAITTIGLDVAKSVFQVHGIDAQGNVLIRLPSPGPCSFLPSRKSVSANRGDR
jgi:hypothetical protein